MKRLFEVARRWARIAGHLPPVEGMARMLERSFVRQVSFFPHE